MITTCLVPYKYLNSAEFKLNSAEFKLNSTEIYFKFQLNMNSIIEATIIPYGILLRNVRVRYVYIRRKERIFLLYVILYKLFLY
jgi:hypothetical protein